MGGKLRIAFLVILVGVFFFQPDGADGDASGLKCECGTKHGPEARATGDCVEDPDNKDRRMVECPGGFCTKSYRESSGSEAALNRAIRSCWSAKSGPPPHMGCKHDTTDKSAPNTGDSQTKLITCFCNDKDFCNSVGQLRGMSWTQLSVSAIFLGVILSRIGGIQ